MSLLCRLALAPEAVAARRRKGASRRRCKSHRRRHPPKWPPRARRCVAPCPYICGAESREVSDGRLSAGVRVAMCAKYGNSSRRADFRSRRSLLSDPKHHRSAERLSRSLGCAPRRSRAGAVEWWLRSCMDVRCGGGPQPRALTLRLSSPLSPFGRACP